MANLIETEEYVGPERRRYTKTLEQLEKDILQMFADHEKKEMAWIAKMRADFSEAFPGGDVRGHCEAHEAMIKAKRAEEAFWESAKTEAIKNGVAGLFSVLKIVLVLAVLGAAYKVGLGEAAAKILGVAK